MQQDSKIQDDNTDMNSPEISEDSGTQGTSIQHLIIFVLALIFMLVAGSAAIYRYIQRMNDQPKSRHVWTPRENIVKPSPELLSTSLRYSIKKRVDCPSCATKYSSPQS